MSYVSCGLSSDFGVTRYTLPRIAIALVVSTRGFDRLITAIRDVVCMAKAVVLLWRTRSVCIGILNTWVCTKKTCAGCLKKAHRIDRVCTGVRLGPWHTLVLRIMCTPRGVGWLTILECCRHWWMVLGRRVRLALATGGLGDFRGRILNLRVMVVLNCWSSDSSSVANVRGLTESFLY